MGFLHRVINLVSGEDRNANSSTAMTANDGAIIPHRRRRRRRRRPNLQPFSLSDTTFLPRDCASPASNEESPSRPNTPGKEHTPRLSRTSSSSSYRSSCSSCSSSTQTTDATVGEVSLALGSLALRRTSVTRLPSDTELFMSSEDLLLNVCSFLDIPDLVVLQSLNKTWNKVSTSNLIWRPILMRFLRSRDSQLRATRSHFTSSAVPNSDLAREVNAADIDFSTYNNGLKNSFNSKLLRAASDPLNDYHQQFIEDTVPKGASEPSPPGATCTPRDTPPDKRVRSYTRNYLVNNNVELSRVKFEKMGYLFEHSRSGSTEKMLGETPYDSILYSNAKRNPLSRLPAFGFNGDSRTVYERDTDFLCATCDLSYRQMFILSKTQGPTRWLKPPRSSAANTNGEQPAEPGHVPAIEEGMEQVEFAQPQPQPQPISFASTSTPTTSNSSPRFSLARFSIRKLRRHYSSPEILGSSYSDNGQSHQRRTQSQQPEPESSGRNRTPQRHLQPFSLPQQLTVSSAVAVAGSAATTLWSHTHEYRIKLLMLGDAGVGKSNICLRFSENTFVENTEAGSEFVCRTVTDHITESRAQIQIFDPETQPVPPQYYRQAQGFAVVFDLTKYSSFSNVMMWLLELTKFTGQEPPTLILIGNKADLVEQREVNFLEAMAFSYKNKMHYIETSAKTGFNVDLAVCSLLNICLKKDSSCYNLFGLTPYYKTGSRGSSRDVPVGLGFRYAASSAACL